ncbi:hypothetical protein [Paraliobacillus sp. JSM ZJ581]
MGGKYEGNQGDSKNLEALSPNIKLNGFNFNELEDFKLIRKENVMI